MPCPFCADITAVIPDKEQNILLHCLGDFALPQSLYNGLDNIMENFAKQHRLSKESIRCFLKYKIANAIAFSKKTKFNLQDIETMLSHITPLTNIQRINQLILFIGQRTEHPGISLCKSFKDSEAANSSTQVASIGNFVNSEAMYKMLGDVDFKHFFNIGQGPLNISLTNKGWEKFQDLQKIKEGRRVFVAMSFGDKNTNEQRKSFFELSIKKPLQEIGFSAERVDTKTRVGLIDLQIIQDIAQSSLVIADISDNNLGVYWEAGYAEGIGRPVLYIRDGNKEKPHFDVQHRQRIDFSSPEELKEQLKKFVNDNFKKELI